MMRRCSCQRPLYPIGGAADEKAEVRIEPRTRNAARPSTNANYQLLDSAGQPTVGQVTEEFQDAPPRPAVMPPQMRRDQSYSDRRTITRDPVTIRYAPLTTYQRGRGPTRF